MQISSHQKTLVTWCLIFAVMALILWLLAPVLAPFVIAAVLAYALTPMVNWLDSVWHGRVPRLLAVVVVELVFLVLTLTVLLMIVPILLKELPLMQQQLPALLDKANASLGPLLSQWGFNFSLDIANIKGFALKYLSANFEDMFGSVLASLKLGGSVAFAVIGNAILIPVVLFYLLMEWPQLVRRVQALIPVRMRAATDHFVLEADTVLGQYLRGQLLVMGILAVYYSLGLALFGLDLALPIGAFTGLAVFVPYLGFGLGLILAILAGLLEFSASAGVGYTAIMVVVVYGLGQLLESFLLTPRLVGERIGLHPLAVIFALLAFGQLFGFVGVLVALPVSAILVVAIRRAKTQYLASQLYRG